MGRTARLVERARAQPRTQTDEAAAARIPADGIRFRRALGPERVGHDGVLAWLRGVHAAVPDCRCIETLVEQGPCAAARMRFVGVRRGLRLGIAPTGRTVARASAAFVEAADGRLAALSALSALGDLDGLG